MAITVNTPVVLEAAKPARTADRFEITSFTYENRAEGPALTIAVIVGTYDSAQQVWIERWPLQSGPLTYIGQRLETIMADAAQRIVTLMQSVGLPVAPGLTPALAYYMGTRDALYRALVDDRIIPA